LTSEVTLVAGTVAGTGDPDTGDEDAIGAAPGTALGDAVAATAVAGTAAAGPPPAPGARAGLAPAQAVAAVARIAAIAAMRKLRIRNMTVSWSRVGGRVCIGVTLRPRRPWWP
jgi:hypothetical protein